MHLFVVLLSAKVEQLNQPMIICLIFGLLVTVLIFPHLTLNIVFSWRQVSEAQDESLFVSLFFSFFPLIHR